MQGRGGGGTCGSRCWNRRGHLYKWRGKRWDGSCIAVWSAQPQAVSSGGTLPQLLQQRQGPGKHSDSTGICIATGKAQPQAVEDARPS